MLIIYVFILKKTPFLEKKNDFLAFQQKRVPFGTLMVAAFAHRRKTLEPHPCALPRAEGRSYRRQAYKYNGDGGSRTRVLNIQSR